MKFFDILRTANHNLFRNKVRTMLTVIAIFVGSFTIILNVAINTGVNSFIDEQTASLGGDNFIMLMPSGSSEMASSMVASSEPVEFIEKKTGETEIGAFSDEDIEKLKQIDGIDADSFYSPAPLSGTGYYASDKTDKKYEIQNLMILPPGNFKIPLAAGKLVDQNEEAKKKNQVVLAPGYREALGYETDEDIIGQTITISIKNEILDKWTAIDVEVVGVEASGIVSSSMGTLISHAVYDALADAVYEGYPSEYRDNQPNYYIMATYDTNRFSEDEIKQAIADAGYEAWTVSDMMGMIRTFFDAIMIVFTIFGSIALLAAAIGIINTLLMSVEERTREIGLDKALGMSSGRVFTEFAVEAISLGFWGSAFGVVVAMFIGTLANSAVHAPGGFLAELPTFNLFEFTASNIIPFMIIIMFIAFLAGTIPAWKAAHKNPIDALRYE